jgi:hypothetical protein
LIRPQYKTVDPVARRYDVRDLHFVHAGLQLSATS